MLAEYNVVSASQIPFFKIACLALPVFSLNPLYTSLVVLPFFFSVMLIEKLPDFPRAQKWNLEIMTLSINCNRIAMIVKDLWCYEKHNRSCIACRMYASS